MSGGGRLVGEYSRIVLDDLKKSERKILASVRGGAGRPSPAKL